MILELDRTTNEELVNEIAQKHEAIIIKQNEQYVLVTPSKYKEALPQYHNSIKRTVVFADDMQLSAKSYLPHKRLISISDKIIIGGNTFNTLMITGPCSVESEEQITQAAELCVKLGIKVLRAGAFKPRTSPYTFQGLGVKGLQLLAKMRDKYGLKIISEVRDSTHVNEVIEYADIIQIGAKAMYDHGILKASGKSGKPVLLKRGFGTTLQEFVQAAEFILSSGNERVILCERGIRTFETKTRFTLDLCGVAYLKEYTNLPIIVDPSHAIGYAYGVPDLTRACVAMGVDGLLIETHPNPKIAKSDAAQQLNFEQFTNLYHSLKPIANAVGYNLI
jgi:3-deoxy-7-phosphoheptulonate synthase